MDPRISVMMSIVTAFFAIATLVGILSLVRKMTNLENSQIQVCRAMIPDGGFYIGDPHNSIRMNVFTTIANTTMSKKVQLFALGRAIELAIKAHQVNLLRPVRQHALFGEVLVQWSETDNAVLNRRLELIKKKELVASDFVPV